MGKHMTLDDASIEFEEGYPKRVHATFDVTDPREFYAVLDEGGYTTDDQIAHLLGYDALASADGLETTEVECGADSFPIVRFASSYDKAGRKTDVSLTLKGRVSDAHGLMTRLSHWFRANARTKKGLDAYPDETVPHVTRVHLGGNGVVLTWSDGTVTKLQPHPDDEFDTLAGVIAQSFRKIGRNRVGYAKFDPVSEALVAGSYTPDELRYLAEVIKATAGAMECDGFDPDYAPGE